MKFSLPFSFEFTSVIELSGGREGVRRVQPPPVHFSTSPACSQKLPWGLRLNPPRAAFNNSMYLALCLHQKISSTCELHYDPIVRGFDSLVDYLFVYFSRCRTC